MYKLGRYVKRLNLESQKVYKIAKKIKSCRAVELKHHAKEAEMLSLSLPHEEATIGRLLLCHHRALVSSYNVVCDLKGKPPFPYDYTCGSQKVNEAVVGSMAETLDQIVNSVLEMNTLRLHSCFKSQKEIFDKWDDKAMGGEFEEKVKDYLLNYQEKILGYLNLNVKWISEGM